MGSTISYEACLEVSDRVSWKIDEVLGGRQLDFGRVFLPESLAGSEELEFLAPRERRLHNQIRGCGYLATFGLVEEFILPFVVDHARATWGDDGLRRRALVNFASEEAKHIELFRRFHALFVEGFGRDCPCIGPPEAIAEHVLGQPPLGVALMILHIEWMTLGHYTASARDEERLDPMFRDLLRFHWLEESQHAKMDWLVVEELTATMADDEIEAGIAAYEELLRFFDQGLRSQAELDLATLKEGTTREWSRSEEQAYLERQHTALRWTYVISGMTNETFLERVEELRPGTAQRLQQLAQEL